MISVSVPLFVLGGALGYWIARKKELPVRLILGGLSGCAFVGIFIVALVLGGDH